MVRDWGVSNTWVWQPATPGSYLVQVWMRTAGSVAVYDAWRQAAASVSLPPAITITSVTPSLAGGVAGNSVTWSATAVYGIPPDTFQFWVYDGAQWRLGQDWSPSSTWTWTPSAPGTYNFFRCGCKAPGHRRASMRFAPSAHMSPPAHRRYPSAFR